jgi:hemolysin III
VTVSGYTASRTPDGLTGAAGGSGREAVAGRTIHLLALSAAIGAAGWLLLTAVPTADARQAAALGIYGCGLIGMVTASAAYSLSKPCRRKELLRWVDHAVIFVMIAGTYTPFAAFALRDIGGLLCAAIWSMAAVGVAVTLAFPRRFERSLLALYLVMGWLVVCLGPDFLRHLSTHVLLLLFAGGIAYSMGAIIHSRCRFRFHNAVWHALVVAGAGMHWAAIIGLLPPPASTLSLELGHERHAEYRIVPSSCGVHERGDCPLLRELGDTPRI